MTNEPKRCGGPCRKLYRTAAFDPHAVSSDGLQPFCRTCDWDAKRKPHRGWAELQRGAVKRRLRVTISEAEYLQLIQPNKCRWCRGPLFHWSGHWIDRRDNRGHYEPGNVCPCCKWCNRHKGNLPEAIWEDTIALWTLKHGRDGVLYWPSLGEAYATKRPDVSRMEIVNSNQTELFKRTA